jgi:hypothetical protein
LLSGTFNDHSAALAAGAVAAAAPGIASRTAFATPVKPGAHDRLTLGFIGLGKQSRGQLQWALG